jgi:hypothetical protein
MDEARPPLVERIVLLAGESLGLSLLIWAGHEFRVWLPGGTRLFDFPDKAIMLAVFATMVFFLCALLRAALSLRSPGAKFEFGLLVVLTLWYPVRFLVFCSG